MRFALRIASISFALALACAPLVVREASAQTESAASTAVTPPRRIGDEPVAYPGEGKGDGEVRLLLTIGVDGSVRAAEVEAGREPFAAAARSAALGWTYEPARRGDRAIAAKIRVVVAFHAPVAPEPEPEREAGAADVPSTVAGRKATTPKADEPEEVRVRGARPDPGRTATLARAEVRQIPGAFGDPFRAIEVLPGVTPIVSGLPFFFIRGAPPGNVGYFLDGIRVPVLFHVGAGPSVIHPGLVERVDLYPGGYPARFGRFAGGIVSGETQGPAPETRGEYNLRIFDAGALAESPFANGKGNILLGGRYSFTGLVLTQLSPDTTLQYWDYQARVGYDLGPRDRMTVFAFGSYDFLGQRTPTTTLTGFETEFHRIDVRYDHRFGSGGKIRTAVTVGQDRTRIQEDRYVRDRIVATRTELEHRLSSRALLRAGTDVQVDTYDVQTGTDPLGTSANRIASTFPSRSDLVLGVRGDVVVEATSRFEIIPGARFDLFTSDGAEALGADPRLATRLALSERTKLLTAMGVAHQPPSFVLPLPGVQPGGLRGGLQRSIQESMGIEQELGAGVTATLTLFHNAFFHMSDPLSVTAPEPDGCPPGSLPTGSLAGDRLGGAGRGGNGLLCGKPRFREGKIGPDRTGGGGGGADSADASDAARSFEARTIGSSYGLELFVKRRLTERLGGFLSYTLSRSTRSYGDRTFIATFDRTHVANAALAYDLGRGWRAGAKVVFYTGLPKAQTPGDDSTRLPAFFRVDARIEKRWQLGRRAWISAIAEWLNASLSKEALSTRCTLNGCEAEMIGPVTIPSIGIEGGF